MFGTKTLRWVLFLKLEVEETPTIHPSDRWKLNSSRILSLAFCVVAIMRFGGDPDRPATLPFDENICWYNGHVSWKLVFSEKT